jgi:uncharacterized protein YjdB
LGILFNNFCFIIRLVSFSKKNLIIIGAVLVILILAIFINIALKSKKPAKVVETIETDYKDFDTKLEEPTPTNTPTPTPTPKPTLIPTSTPTPTLVPTRQPTTIPTRRPTRTPTATPTPDTNIYATGVVLDVTELILEINESYQVSYRVEPANTTNQSIYWSSNDGNIALVTSSGWITGKNLGETIIKASTSNNMTTLIKVRVVKSKITTTPTATPTPVAYPEKIDLSLIRLILKVGEIKQLYVKYSPENIINKNVTWSVDNTSIITISKTGLVTAKKTGTAIVTVVTVNGLSDKATVFVYLN